MKKLFFILLLCACGHKNEPQETTDPMDSIKAKGEKYLSLSSQVQDHYGFLPGCDSLLFTSLYKVSGAAVDLKQAKDADGQWYRTPGKDCFPSQTISTISRDMILGLMISLWVNHDLEEAKALVKYFEDHNFVMGQSDGSVDGKNRVFATPSFAGLAYRLRWRLGGDYNVLADTPNPVFPQTGYEAHLQALNTLLFGLMEGSISNAQLEALKSQTERQPDNALYQALRSKFDPDRQGNQSEAFRILSEESLFPSDRLPTSHDHCVDYLFNHDKNDGDWLPCEPLVVHSGLDLLFANFVIFRNSFGFTAWD